MADGDNENDLSEELSLLNTYSREIAEYKDPLSEVFEDTVSSDRVHNGFGDVFDNLEICMANIAPPEEANDLADALIQVVGNYSKDVHKDLMEYDDDLAETVSYIVQRHGHNLQRRLKQKRQGRHYWSNIHTDLKIRSSRPAFNHELIIDEDRQVTIHSSLNATLTLVQHFLNQVSNVHRVLGDDVLSYIPPEKVEDIERTLEEFSEELDEYELDQKEVPINNQKDEEAGVEDETADVQHGDAEVEDEETGNNSLGE
jgi:hypothetical protein